MPEDRLNRILQLIEQNQSISVQELTEKLYVSPSTVRRDLAELARRGKLARSFGGAMAVSAVAYAAPIQMHKTIKGTSIGSCAAQMLREGETVFLGSSPLVCSMTADIRPGTELTAVTDSMKIAEALCGSITHLYCTGGKYLLKQDLFFGAQASRLASRFRYDLCFLSCDGVLSDGGVAFRGLERLNVLQAVLRSSRRKVLLCSEEQLGREASHILFSLRDIDLVITDAPHRIPAGYSSGVIGTDEH